LDEDGKYHISLDKRAIKIVLLVVFLVLSSAVAYVYSGSVTPNEDASQFSNVVPANIEEVYPLFMCPCCGTPLDPNNICCGLAKERIDYISALSDSGISNDQIVLATVKKYGIDLLINESMKNEVKKELSRQAPEDRPKIFISPIFYDLGDVSFAGGVVKTTLKIENHGESDLVLSDIDTSCGCTSASVTKDGNEGPVFGMKMHGTNPVGWSETLRPDEKAMLNVYYDPTVHPELRGPVTRMVSLYSNDPVDFKIDVTIDVNQVD
jgi:hypothetical protein